METHLAANGRPEIVNLNVKIPHKIPPIALSKGSFLPLVSNKGLRYSQDVYSSQIGIDLRSHIHIIVSNTGQDQNYPNNWIHLHRIWIGDHCHPLNHPHHIGLIRYQPFTFPNYHFPFFIIRLVHCYILN